MCQHLVQIDSTHGTISLKWNVMDIRTVINTVLILKMLTGASGRGVSLGKPEKHAKNVIREYTIKEFAPSVTTIYEYATYHDHSCWCLHTHKMIVVKCGGLHRSVRPES